MTTDRDDIASCPFCGACDYGENADAVATVARCEHAAALIVAEIERLDRAAFLKGRQ